MSEKWKGMPGIFVPYKVCMELKSKYGKRFYILERKKKVFVCFCFLRYNMGRLGKMTMRTLDVVMLRIVVVNVSLSNPEVVTRGDGDHHGQEERGC